MPNKLTIYNEKAEKVKELALNPAVFAVKVNNEVIHQVVVSLLSSSRQNLAHAKGRGEVRGGGRKPWKQKGTGRARHGSSRSPIWIGGGVTFGPSNSQNFNKKVNKKMKRKALFMALSDRVNENKVKLLDKFEIKEFKTKQIIKILDKLDLRKSTLIVNNAADEKLVKSVRNIPKVDIIEARNLNIIEVLRFQNLLMTEESLKQIDRTFTEKK